MDDDGDDEGYYVRARRLSMAWNEEMEAVYDEARRKVSAAVQAEMEMVRGKTDEARRIVSAAVQEEIRWIVGRIEHAPIYLQFNRYIHGGYRLHVRHWSDFLYSLFSWHNETVNIWSHLIGFVLMMCYCIYTFYNIEIKDFFDKIIFLLFFLGACAMFLLSSLYHLFNCHHSEHVFNNLLTCDYVGIFSMILGSCISALHFCFYCFWIPRVMYQTGIALLVLGGIALVTLPKFREPKYHYVKVLFYICTVSFAALPLAHMSALVGFYDTTRWWILLALYACGIAIYTTKFPECRFPGKFDTWLASHQLWHIFVLAAGCWHYYSIITMYQQVATEGCKGIF